MFEQLTLWDIPNATSSPVSGDGATPSALPDGPTISQSGQEAVHASRSLSPAKGSESVTPATSGLFSQSSSASADLQRSLVSRLQAKLAGRGSPEYSLTWKRWDIPGQAPICVVRASALRISDSGYTGLDGWRSPQHSDGEGGVMEIRPGKAGKYKLRDEALLVGWPSAKHTEGELSSEAQLPGWATLTTQDSSDNAGPSQSHQNSLPLNCGATLASGPTPSGTSAPTAKSAGFRLNPRFSLWLMGFPPEWASCGDRAMQSFLKSRRRSSRQ
jgi:hypothetical protein